MANEKHKEALLGVILKINDKQFLAKFLEDLLTLKEFEDIIKRWQIVKQLAKGTPQRQVAKNLGVSIATITRGSRVLQSKNSAFKQILKKYGL